jgi:hypothetical protein
MAGFIHSGSLFALSNPVTELVDISIDPGRGGQFKQYAPGLTTAIVTGIGKNDIGNEIAVQLIDDEIATFVALDEDGRRAYIDALPERRFGQMLSPDHYVSAPFMMPD